MTRDSDGRTGCDYAGRYVLAFANDKGGVAKTTSCVNVGAVLAQQGRRVLCIDLDPQGSLTTALGIPRREAEGQGTHFLLGREEVTLEESVVPTEVDNLTLVPTCGLLSQYEDALAGASDRANRLRAKLADSFRTPRAGAPEIVLLDCPPSLGLLTANALVAATHMVVPVTPRLYSLKSMAQLAARVATLHREGASSVKLLGILVTMFEENTSLDMTLYRLLKEKIEGEFGDFMFARPIARSAAISEAETGGKPLVVREPRSPAAAAHVQLAAEVMDRLRRDELGTLGALLASAAV